MAEPQNSLTDFSKGGATLSPEDAARFHRSYAQRGPTECWVWPGGSTRSEPQFQVGGKLIRARRVALALSGASLRPDQQVRVSCGNARCVNPAHLHVSAAIKKDVERYIWHGMLRRCHNPKDAAFPRYGGRGITVCPEWQDRTTGFAAFLAHVGPRPSSRHSIDRIDNQRGYEPGNVRWALPVEQAKDYGTVVEYEGEQHPLGVWAERFGISPLLLRRRLDKGWLIHDALTTPAGATRQRQRVVVEGRLISEWAAEAGLPPEVVRRRMALGQTLREALATPVGPRGRPRKVAVESAEPSLAEVTVSALVPAKAAELLTLGDGGVPDVAELVRVWLGSKKPTTVRAYAGDLRAFADFMAKDVSAAINTLIASPQTAANLMVLRYRQHIEGLKLAPATIARRLAAIRSIVELGRLVGVCSITVDVPGPHVEATRDMRGPAREIYRTMLTLAHQKPAPRGVRDEVLLRLMGDMGMRRFETTGLRLQDIDLTNRTLHILGKARSQREAVTIPSMLMEPLTHWLAVRPASKTDALLVGLPPEHLDALNEMAVWRIVRAYGDEVGTLVRPHGLRHSAITTTLDRNGGNLRAAQRFGRQKDPKTTMSYDDSRHDLAGEMAELISEPLDTPDAPRTPWPN